MAQPVVSTPLLDVVACISFDSFDLSTIKWALQLTMSHCERALRMTEASIASSDFYATYPMEARDMLRERRSQAYELLKRLGE